MARSLFFWPIPLNQLPGRATVFVRPMSRTHEDIQDELLVLQSQAGDAAALRTLIERWQPRLGRLAWRLTGEREAARDIVQDAWLAIMRGLHRLDDPARFRSWAYRIVRNKCADWTRRRVIRRNAADEICETTAAACANPSHETDSTGDVARLRDALAELPNEQRAILSLHYLDGMSVAEIARVLGVPNGTVKSRLYHARNRLKQMLERIKS